MLIRALTGVLLVPLVLSLSSCNKNADVVKSIQQQLKLLEEDDARCCCDRKECTDGVKVGFLATTSKNLENFAADAIIVFDTVTTNVGGGYDTSTGIFTAPVDGLYVFSWTTLTNPDKILFTYIEFNGQKLAFNHGDGRISSNRSFPSSQSAVVQMKKHEHVSIRNFYDKAGFLHGSGWSTFIGYRI